MAPSPAPTEFPLQVYADAAVTFAGLVVSVVSLYLVDSGYATGSVAAFFGIALYGMQIGTTPIVAMFVAGELARLVTLWIMFPLQTYAELNFTIYYFLMAQWLWFFPLMIKNPTTHVNMLYPYLLGLVLIAFADIYDSPDYVNVFPNSSSQQAGHLLSSLCFARAGVATTKLAEDHKAEKRRWRRGLYDLVLGVTGIVAGCIVSFVQGAITQGSVAVVLVAILIVDWFYMNYDGKLKTLVSRCVDF